MKKLETRQNVIHAFYFDYLTRLVASSTRCRSHFANVDGSCETAFLDPVCARKPHEHTPKSPPVTHIVGVSLDLSKIEGSQMTSYLLQLKETTHEFRVACCSERQR